MHRPWPWPGPHCRELGGRQPVPSRGPRGPDLRGRAGKFAPRSGPCVSDPEASGALTARVDFLGNPYASRSQLLRADSLEAPTPVADAPTSRGLTPGRGGGRPSRARTQRGSSVLSGPCPGAPSCAGRAPVARAALPLGPVPADRPRRLRAHTGRTALRCGHVPARGLVCRRCGGGGAPWFERKQPGLRNEGPAAPRFVLGKSCCGLGYTRRNAHQGGGNLSEGSRDELGWRRPERGRSSGCVRAGERASTG